MYEVITTLPADTTETRIGFYTDQAEAEEEARQQTTERADVFIFWHVTPKTRLLCFHDLYANRTRTH
jgi:hypothetical protein